MRRLLVTTVSGAVVAVVVVVALLAFGPDDFQSTLEDRSGLSFDWLPGPLRDDTTEVPPAVAPTPTPEPATPTPTAEAATPTPTPEPATPTPTPEPPTETGVVVYKGLDFQGESLQLDPETVYDTIEELSDFNDEVRSMRVPSGTTVTVCVHASGPGSGESGQACQEFAEDVPALPEELDQEASYFSVS